jgi:uncharacterized protein
MRLDLSHYRQPVSEFSRVYEASAFAQGADEYRVVEPVSLAMVIHKDEDRFRLTGTVKTTLELTCSRCLDPFQIPLDQAFDLRYLPEGGLPARPSADEDGIEMADDDVSVTFYRDEQIDLGDLMREQFYLALPMKPLCRPDCQGLCPQCGTNRNIATCECQPHWEDPRLAALKTILTEREHDDA